MIIYRHSHCIFTYQQETELIGETLLESAEEFGRIISSTLTKDTLSINSTDKPSIEKDNVG